MGIFSGVQDFFHSLTTNDHYASSDASKANNKKRPISNFPNGSSSSITMLDNSSSASLANGNQPNSNRSSTSNAPFQYRPGMRSQLQHNSSSSDIQLQDYVDGQPPLPSIGDLWTKLEDWLDREFPELGDDLEGGCTANDLNEFESDLAVSLPLDVRESYQIHDGQVQLGKKRGLIYGYTLMDLESIAAEAAIWRKTADKLEEHRDLYFQIKTSKAASSSNSAPLNDNHRKILNFMENQRSIPENYIQEVYAHPAWIPLVKDNGGNNIAIDLAPGPSGRWGQIILFGRDFDTKYVVATSWNEFLLNFYEDLNEGKFQIDEIDEDLNFCENGRTANYFNVLKFRANAVYRANQRKLQQQQSGTANGGQNIYNSLNASRSQSRVSLPRETLISPINSSPNLNKSQQPSNLLQRNEGTKTNFVIDDEDDEDEHDIIPPTKEVLIAPVDVEEEEEKEVPVAKKEPAIEEPTVEEPVAEESLAEEPAIEESAVEDLVTKEEPISEPSAVQESVLVEEPVAEEKETAEITDKLESVALKEDSTEQEQEEDDEEEAVEETGETVKEEEEEEETVSVAQQQQPKKNNKKKNKKKGKK